MVFTRKIEVLLRTDLVALVGSTIPLRRSRHVFRGRCPFHEGRAPVLVVDGERGQFRCYNCGAKGNALDWVERTQRMTKAEALEYLAARLDPPPEPLTLPGMEQG